MAISLHISRSFGQEMERVLAVIPARGGSKAVPKKNLYPVAGKPLLAYSIEHAQLARAVTRFIVSTDNEEIAELAKRYGADVPFIRPPALARDGTTMVPVVQHALQYVEKEEDQIYSAIVILQPTSPLRAPEDIDRVVEILLDSDADTVVTICKVDKLSHPFLVQELDVVGGLRLVPHSGSRYRDVAHANREDLSQVVRLNGAVYGMKRKTLVDEGVIIGPHVRGVWMEKSRSIDIDDEDDFKLAEAMILARKED